MSVGKDYKISVIIPVYNTEKYLPECLDSVVSQDLQDIEVICVNDGSEDNSAIILDEYSRRYSNIHIITQSNHGLSAARNVGLNYAKGKYVYFLDSDDKIVPNGLRELFQYAESERTDVLLFDGDVEYDSDDIEVCKKINQNGYHRKIEYGVFDNPIELLEEFLKNNDYIVSSCLQLFKTEFLKKNQIIYSPGILHEDNLFSFQCFFHATRVGHVKKALFVRRVREASIMTQKKTWKHFWGCFFTYLKMSEIIENKAKDIGKRDFDVLTQVADNMLNLSREIYRYDLEDNERENLKELSKEDYWKIEQLVVRWNDLQEKEELYAFPYYLIPPSSKIVLYGAGNIGRRYYEQLQKTKYAEVVKWIDKNYVSIRRERLPVSDVALDDCEYDFLFLAIANEETAALVIEGLESQGVSKQKIIWCGKEYFAHRKNQMELLYARMDMYNQYCMGSQKKIFLFMTPEHGNLGDYAIALAEKIFLSKYFKEYQVIEVTMPQWEFFKEEYLKIVSPQDLVCISGGGYLGDMWFSGQVMKEIISLFPHNLKVLFPNTLTYIDNSESSMKNDAKFFRNQNNLLIMARDNVSYERMLKYNYQEEDNIFLFPDMGLLLDYSKTCVERREIGICLRNDKEKAMKKEDFEQIMNVISRRNMPYKITDIHLNKRITRTLGEMAIKNKVREFKGFKLVVTDRLHGMIFAAISGTPCIAFDNLTKKVSGVYEWIKGLPYIYFCENIEAFEGLFEEIIGLDGGFTYNTELTDAYWKDMSICIKKKW